MIIKNSPFEASSYPDPQIKSLEFHGFGGAWWGAGSSRALAWPFPRLPSIGGLEQTAATRGCWNWYKKGTVRRRIDAWLGLVYFAEMSVNTLRCREFTDRCWAFRLMSRDKWKTWNGGGSLICLSSMDWLLTFFSSTSFFVVVKCQDTSTRELVCTGGDAPL